MVETATDLRCNGGFGHGVAPVQQEVVVIEDVVALLGHDIGLEGNVTLAVPASIGMIDDRRGRACLGACFWLAAWRAREASFYGLTSVHR